MLNNFTNLKPELVEEGIVLKSEEVELNIPSSEAGNIKMILSRLVLYPKAKIKYHVHQKESQFYIPQNTDVIPRSFCKKGEGHSLENITDTTIEVIEIKIVDGD